ncbi:hypothetical protein CMI47_16305 [Candidatus Pacearchaeota archaeon]|nr:hypothetical protein [Candidatus Pacearchaeota archaeon]
MSALFFMEEEYDLSTDEGAQAYLDFLGEGALGRLQSEGWFSEVDEAREFNSLEGHVDHVDVGDEGTILEVFD